MPFSTTLEAAAYGERPEAYGAGVFLRAEYRWWAEPPDSVMYYSADPKAAYTQAAYTFSTSLDTPVWTGAAFFVLQDVSTLGTAILRSYDGISWVEVSPASGSITVVGVAEGYLYLRYSATLVRRTLDGVTFQDVSMGGVDFYAVSGLVGDIAASGVLLMAGSDGSQDGVFKSADGVNFTFTVDAGYSEAQLLWVPARGQFIRRNGANVIQYSADGTAWATFAGPQGSEISSSGFTLQVSSDGYVIVVSNGAPV